MRPGAESCHDAFWCTEYVSTFLYLMGCVLRQRASRCRKLESTTGRKLEPTIATQPELVPRAQLKRRLRHRKSPNLLVFK